MAIESVVDQFIETALALVQANPLNEKEHLRQAEAMLYGAKVVMMARASLTELHDHYYGDGSAGVEQQ